MRRVYAFLSVLVIIVFLASLTVSCAKRATTKGEEVSKSEAAGPEIKGEKVEEIKEEVIRPEEGIKETEVAKATPEEAKEMVAEAEISFEDIHFDFDKYFIRNDAKPVLEKLAEYLLKNGSVKVLIEGHCDERGTNEYNLALGEKRASAAKEYLVNLGVSGDRIDTISYGEERPLDSGHNEEAWAKNRRDHFVILK